MSTSTPTMLPRTRSVSPLHLNIPGAHPRSHSRSVSPGSSSSEDTFVAPDLNARHFTFHIYPAAPPEPFRPARGRSRPGVDDSFRSDGAAAPRPTRSDRIKLAGQNLIGTSAFAGAVGAWLIAGMPLILAVVVAWLSYILASAAFEFVIAICLD